MPDYSNPTALIEMLQAAPLPRVTTAAVANRCCDCGRDVTGCYVTLLAINANAQPTLQVCDSCLASGRWAAWMKQPWTTVSIADEERRCRG